MWPCQWELGGPVGGPGPVGTPTSLPPRALPKGARTGDSSLYWPGTWRTPRHRRRPTVCPWPGSGPLGLSTPPRPVGFQDHPPREDSWPGSRPRGCGRASAQPPLTDLRGQKPGPGVTCGCECPRGLQPPRVPLWGLAVGHGQRDVSQRKHTNTRTREQHKCTALRFRSGAGRYLL